MALIDEILGGSAPGPQLGPRELELVRALLDAIGEEEPQQRGTAILPGPEPPTDYLPQTEPRALPGAPGARPSFLDVLGQAFADVPPAASTPGYLRMSPRDRFLAALLTGAAGGFGRARTAGIQRREAGEAAQRTETAQARQIAAGQAREAERGKIEAARARAGAQAREAEARAAEARERRLAQPKPEPSLARIEAEAFARARGSARGGAGQAASEEEDLIAAASESVASGESSLTNYPFKMRPKIVKFLSDTGQTILPERARSTLATLNAARGVVDNLEAISNLVNTATSPVGRITTGVRRKVGGILQTDVNASLFESARLGFLSTLARSTGEKGTLNEGDIERAKTLVPTMLDIRPVARGKILQMRRYLDGLEDRTIKTYTTKHPQIEDRSWFDLEPSEGEP